MGSVVKDSKEYGTFLKSFDIDTLPSNEHYDCAYGDVFLVKMNPLEYGEAARALYDDIPENWSSCEGLRAIESIGYGIINLCSTYVLAEK